MREIEFEINGTKHIAKVKRLNFGEKNEVEDGALDAKVVGKTVIANVNSGKLKELAILKSCECSTYDLNNVRSIRELTSEAGELLWEAYQDENTQNFQEGDQSNTQSKQE